MPIKLFQNAILFIIIHSNELKGALRRRRERCALRAVRLRSGQRCHSAASDSTIDGADGSDIDGKIKEEERGKVCTR